MPKCGVRRSDGMPCDDELGHYGGHVWPELELPILRVGDRMRMSVQFARMIQDEPDDYTIIVRVSEIRTEDDGTKTLYMERIV